MRCLIVLAVLATIPVSTSAAPITIDVTGTIRTYLTHDDSPFGVDETSTLSHLDVQGFVTYDLSLAPPPVTSPFGDGGVHTRTSIGPLVEFVFASLTWAKGTFVASPLLVPAGATEVGDALQLVNSIDFLDDFVVADQFAWQNEAGEAALSRTVFRFEDHFISNDTAFPSGNEFPNLATALGRVVVQSVSVSPGDVLNGFQLGIDVTSASLRPAQVPEPGTLALVSLGLAALGVGFGRRRNVVSASGVER